MTPSETVLAYFIPENSTKKYRFSYGLTEVRLTSKNTVLEVLHGGNMGNTLRSIDENLEGAKFPYSVDHLKDLFEIKSERGSPDYLYVLKLSLTDAKF